MRAADLAQLRRLTGTVRLAAEARLAGLRREESDLRARLRALEEARRARAARARATDVSVRAGVDLRWEGWIDGRAEGLATELARLRARIEIARDDLARAFGRDLAAEALANQVRVEILAKAVAKAERAG